MTANKPALRSLGSIALDIQRAWVKPYFGAVPYLGAMMCCDYVAMPTPGPDNTVVWRRTMYGCDTVESVVLYFLNNASTFRGEQAKSLKAELKAHLAWLKKLNAK